MKLLQASMPPRSRMVRRAISQVRRIGVVAHDLEDEVGLDRGAHLGRSAGVGRPPAPRQLLGAEGGGGLLHPLAFEPAEEEPGEQVLRFEDRVAFEHRAPVTVGLLQAQQVGLGGGQRAADRAGRRGGGGAAAEARAVAWTIPASISSRCWLCCITFTPRPGNSTRSLPAAMPVQQAFRPLRRTAIPMRPPAGGAQCKTSAGFREPAGGRRGGATGRRSRSRPPR